MSDNSFDGQQVSAARFLFEVDGEKIGHFMEVGGLEVEVTVESIEEGGQNGFSHRLPGRMSWPNITLKRGVTQTDNLLKWLNKSSGEQFASAGNVLTRSTAAITLMSGTNVRLRSWNFFDAFPVKWSGPQFAATSSDSASESLEIAHHGFTATKP